MNFLGIELLKNFINKQSFQTWHFNLIMQTKFDTHFVGQSETSFCQFLRTQTRCLANI